MKEYELIWKKIKDNFTIILAVCTTLLTILYAILKLIIYVYWKGYFSKLNIDDGLINLNFDGFVFQVVFFGLIILFISYLFWMAKEFFVQNRKNLWDNDKKFKKLIKLVFDSLIYSILLFTLGNIPIVAVLSVLLQVEMTAFNIGKLLIFIYIMELLFITIHLIEGKDINISEKTLEKKIAEFFFKSLTYICFLLSFMFYFGNSSIEKKNKICMMEDKQYAITYSNENYYILHKAILEEKVLTIYKNEQMIISKENCNYIVEYVDDVIVY